MAKKSGATNRDLFPSHHVGKGDKTRTNLASREWQQNYSEIDWSGSQTGFERVGAKLVKRYGPAEPEKLEWAPAVI